jgi:hypothetical protein
MTVYDTIGPSMAQEVFLYMVGVTSYDDDIIGVASGPRDEKAKYKSIKNGFDYTLNLLDPTGYVIEEWLIEGCQIINIDFGSLDYADGGLMEITMTFQPKKFTLLY